MTSLRTGFVVLIASVTMAGCANVLGIDDDHNLAPPESPEGDASTSSSAVSIVSHNARDAATDAVGDVSVSDGGDAADGAGAGGSYGMAQLDASGQTGVTSASHGDDTGTAPDPDAAVSSPVLCASPTGDCVFGGLFTVDRVPVAVTLPNGPAAQLSDDGFELGATTCASGICVTGGITP